MYSSCSYGPLNCSPGNMSLVLIRVPLDLVDIYCFWISISAIGIWSINMLMNGHIFEFEYNIGMCATWLSL